MPGKTEINHAAHENMVKDLIFEIDRVVKQAGGLDPYDTMVAYIVGRYLAPVTVDPAQQPTITLRLGTAKDLLTEMQNAQSGNGDYAFIPIIEELRTRINAVEQPSAATALNELEMQREIRRGAHAALATKVFQDAGLIVPPEVIDQLGKVFFDLESSGINLTVQESRLHR